MKPVRPDKFTRPADMQRGNVLAHACDSVAMKQQLRRVAMALSGGVDSLAAAILLKTNGETEKHD